MKTYHTQQGAIMIEVLVALFFVVVVFVGHIGSQTFMQKSSIEASRRAHAQILVNDMVERMQANRAVAPCYAFTTGTNYPFVGLYGINPTCTGFGTPETQQRATQDLQEWRDALMNGGVTNPEAGAVGGLKNGRGCIKIDETTVPPTYTVSVAWEGSSPQSIPDNLLLDNRCAMYYYGSESPATNRRVISRKVQFGILDS